MGGRRPRAKDLAVCELYSFFSATLFPYFFLNNLINVAFLLIFVFLLDLESEKSDAVDDDNMVQVSAGSTAVALPTQLEQPEPPSPALINPSIWRPNNSDNCPGMFCTQLRKFFA